MDKFVIRKSAIVPVKGNEDIPTSSKTPNQNTCTSPTSHSLSFPNDVADIGKEIIQIKLTGYPKGKDGRSFKKEWFEKFSWLEYSPSRDAAFCYACRQFQPTASKENMFTTIGFRSWKSALEKSKGLVRHDLSKVHILSMSMWAEKLKRVTAGQEISTLVNDEMLQRNRYYVTSIAEIIQFLAVNELPMRGTYNIQEHEEQSLFRNLFEYTLRKDEKLRNYFQSIPKNATYLSPEIQNDVIQVLTDCVRESIVNDIKSADVPFFTILADGTKDRKGRENFAIAVRYCKNGEVYESILCIKSTEELDAQALAELTLNTLQENELNPSHLLSQCYDGASVMSGKHGGLQAILQKRLNRCIPYVHCCNHRLHLVLVKAIHDVSIIKQFFDQCSMLYMFLKRGRIAKNYEGKALSRLLEQRWSGHLHVTNIIFNNYKEITNVLKLVVDSKDYGGDDVTEAIGLLTVVKKRNFRFCLLFMRRVLQTIEPADSQLQARETSLHDSVKIIEATIESLKVMREQENCYEEIMHQSNTGIFEIMEQEYPAKRRKVASSSLKDFVVTETTGTNQEIQGGGNLLNLKQIFVEVLDIILLEMIRRFSDNKELIKAIAAAEELDYDKFQYLSSLGIVLPTKEETTVVKAYLNNIENCNIFQEVYDQRIAFKNTYQLLAATRIFGCSTAVCESTFSVLTRVDRPARSMMHQRLANLVLLAFEKQRTSKIDFNRVLRLFHNVKNRRLQLF